LTLDESPPAPLQSPYPEFTTFPVPGELASFSFAFGSCFRPANEDGGQIFHAVDRLRREQDLRFILLLGDQIYADAYPYNSLGKVACSLDDYRQVYAYTWSRPALRHLLMNLPAFMILDDHEVDDDWSWVDPERRRARIPLWARLERWLHRRSRQECQISPQRVRDALQAYWEHQGLHAPPLVQPLRLNQAQQYSLASDDPGSLAYTFAYGGAAFFVMDTRTMRVRGRRGHTMLGASQWTALENWLLSTRDHYPVKFLVTSCAFLFQVWADFLLDRWSGYPEERARLLNFITDHGIEGVYLLTGDLHSAHALCVELDNPTGTTLPLWEFCSSPFEQVTNWYSRYGFKPLKSSLVVHQELRFVVDRLNFGVISVSPGPERRPKVVFSLYGREGEQLAQI
jgi:alkaline phosphatase D